MKKLILSAAFGAAMLMVPGIGAAQDRGAMMAAMFPDTDNDGATSKSEMTAAADARFATLDTDKDGKLSAAEREAGMGGRMLGRADNDGDGFVTAAEAKAAAEMRFDRLDANKDGKIDKAEKDAAVARMQQMRGGQ